MWINSKAFVTYMQSLGLHSSGQLPIYVAERKDAHTIVRSFLKGLYDAEGHVEYWKPRGTIRITLANKSRDLLDFTYNYLKRCGLKPYLRYSARAFRIQLYRKGDVRWFIRNIGFRYPVKLRKINKYIKLIYPNGPPLGAEG
ncbi:LAGLIDADG family homing endonuclease [Methanopyrus sp.]